jgi:hypothetical protein
MGRKRSEQLELRAYRTTALPTNLGNLGFKYALFRLQPRPICDQNSKISWLTRRCMWIRRSMMRLIGCRRICDIAVSCCNGPAAACGQKCAGVPKEAGHLPGRTCVPRRTTSHVRERQNSYTSTIKICFSLSAVDGSRVLRPDSAWVPPSNQSFAYSVVILMELFSASSSLVTTNRKTRARFTGLDVSATRYGPLEAFPLMRSHAR